VVTAAQAAAADRAAIHAGIPSRALMRSAGLGAVTALVRRYPGRLAQGVTVFAGPGNNGGDAWVVAGLLAAAGVRVAVDEPAPARTADCRAERDAALPLVGDGAATGAERLVIDGLLGTGTRGAPRGAIAEALARLRSARASGATVVALDLPSGLDADTGEDHGAVAADLTVTFGGCKRGLLRRRDLAGEIAVLDIGLGVHAQGDDATPWLVEATWVHAHLPPIAADAHKGTRGRVAVIGGDDGMAGAAILATRAALATGAGLVRAVVAPDQRAAVTAAVPAALTAAWPESPADAHALLADWAHAVLVGPGLGGAHGRRVVEAVARGTTGAHVPLVLDADALNAFRADVDALAALVGGRAVLTPHVAEAARLLGVDTAHVQADPWTSVATIAERSRCVVLLKGVPTLVAAPGFATRVVPRGTPVLATGGSGDVLGGVIATLVAQGSTRLDAATLGAWVHGVAGEIAGGGTLRGTTLEDVLVALPAVWDVTPSSPEPPVLARLAAVPPA
jgi:NAD(P)H-hydrate epimerase